MNPEIYNVIINKTQKGEIDLLKRGTPGLSGSKKTIFGTKGRQIAKLKVRAGSGLKAFVLSV